MKKIQTIESFFKPVDLGRGDNLSSLKHSYPVLAEIKRTQAIVVKIFNINEKELIHTFN